MFHVSQESLSQFLDILMPLMGYELANGIPYLIIYIFLGYFGDPFPIAVFGLNNFLIRIIISPVLMSIVDVSGARFSIAYGAKKYSEIITDFYQTVFTLIIFMFGYFVLSLFSEQLFIAVNVDPKIAKASAYLFEWSTVFTGLGVTSRFLQVFMSSQGKVKDFVFINFFGLFLMIIMSALFIIYFDMRQNGTIPARIIQQGVVASYSLYVFFTKSDPRSVGKSSFKEVFSGYSEFVKRSAKNALGAILQWLTLEINTILAIQLHDINELAVFLAFNGFGPLFFIIGNGFSSTIRVIIGRLIGEGQKKKVREELTAFFFYIFVFSIFNAVWLIGFHVQIAKLYIQDPHLSEMFARIVMVIAVFQWAYMMIYPFFQVFRLFKMEDYFVKVLGTYFLFSDLLVALVLTFYYHLNSLGLIVGHGFSATTTMIIFMRKLFWGIEWDKLPWPNAIPESDLEEGHMLILEEDQK